jgi:hypothetical protein
MGWPTRTDYAAALQQPAAAFRNARLRVGKVPLGEGTLACNRLGLPLLHSGTFAVVCKMNFERTAVAVRLFYWQDAGREARYDAIHRHLASACPPSLRRFAYDPAGITVRGASYPVIVCPWIEGQQLTEWVNLRCQEGDLQAIRRVAERWVETVRELQSAGIAHGDLQHGNVLVTQDERLVLIDYDGMCVPELIDQPLSEVGHAAYQHPGRVGTTLSLGQDDFSAWAILVALRATAADPALWERHVRQIDNEHLLWLSSDLTRPAQSRLWLSLLASPDPQVREWAKALRAALDGPIAAVPRFDPRPTASAERPRPASGMPPRVFISHSSQDRAFVEEHIVGLLRESGIDIWYSPEDIHTSARWEQKIREGLNGCDWFLVVLSPRSVASEWVQGEVHWAMQRRKDRIVPVLIDDCDPGELHLMLELVQHVDFRREPEQARRKLLAVWGR